MPFKSAPLRARYTRIFRDAVKAIEDLQVQIELAKRAYAGGTVSQQGIVDLDEAIIALTSVQPMIESTSLKYQVAINGIGDPGERQLAQDEFDQYMATVEGTFPLDAEDFGLIISRRLAEASLRLEKMQASQQVVRPGPSQASTSTTSQSSPHMIQIPSLALPVFHGAHEQWQEFWELFLENVHSREDIGDATKLCLLRQQLGGEALKSIQALGNEGKQYAVAIQLLQTQYGKSRATTMVLLKRLRLLQPQSSGSLAQLSCAREMEQIIRQLGDELYTALPLQVVFSKFPSHVQQWVIEHPELRDTWDVSRHISYIESKLMSDLTVVSCLDSMRDAGHPPPPKPAQHHADSAEHGCRAAPASQPKPPNQAYGPKAYRTSPHHRPNTENHFVGYVTQPPKSAPQRTLMAMVTLSNSVTGKHLKVPALLDTGSTINVIDEHVASQLQLNVKSRSTNIGTILSRSRLSQAKYSNLTMRTATGEHGIEVMVAPKPLTSKFPHTPLSGKDKRFVEKRKLKLAISGNWNTATPKLIIGMGETLKSFLNEERIVLPSGALLLPTTFGYMPTNEPPASSSKQSMKRASMASPARVAGEFHHVESKQRRKPAELKPPATEVIGLCTESPPLAQAPKDPPSVGPKRAANAKNSILGAIASSVRPTERPYYLPPEMWTFADYD